MRSQINPSIKVPKVAQKNVSCMSSNGPPGKPLWSIEQAPNRTCAKRIKLRVYRFYI